MKIRSYDHFFHKQRASLVREFRDDMVFCLISTTEKKLRDHALWNDFEFSKLSGIQSSNKVFVITKGDKILPQLWVKVDYTNYRTAFRKFLNEYFKFPTQKIPTKWNVDHLLPKSRFKKYTFDYLIRLYLIEGSINKAFGAGYEKKFYREEQKKKPNGGFHMDWISFLKAYGFELPSINMKPADWARWTWDVAGTLEEKGIEGQLFAYHGISTLINLGYTGNYSSLPLPSDLYLRAKEFPSFQCMPSLRELDPN